jgi:DNA-binding transcriptional MocR family regulator
MYQAYKDRYFKMVDTLDINLPKNINFSHPGGGLNLWLNLPYGIMTGSLLKEAAARGIVFAPGRIFFSGSSPQKLNNLRLSFAAVYDEQIERGVHLLCDLLKQYGKGEESPKNIPIL